ncbi:MAG: hypothetical protein NZ898_08745 [Myxococcota bacterium]|nr:hypothetical protein [Myxococcota bacterium]MDW8361712.1 hypothetical protein [Myxococcales bacterium]
MRLAAAGALVWLGGGAALAQDDETLWLYREPTSFTDVVDAFDEHDPFDLNVSVGFSRSLLTGVVQRETNDPMHPEVRRPDVSGARASEAWVDIAKFEHLRNILHFGLDVGVYHDVALFLRLPVVLSDSRELTAPEGRTTEEVNADLVAADPDGRAVPLFQLPFRSPTRSGVPWLDVGAAWAIFNQHRNRHLPTWVVSATGRFATGEPVHACFDRAPMGRDRCPNPNPAGGTLEPGIGDGTNGLRLETRASWRSRYIEPYGGLAFQIGWPGSSKRWFEPGGDLAGFMNTLPPRIGEMTVGLAIIPWEHRGRWQRFALDFRLVGQYVSEGHGYTPLTDPLGSSAHPALTEAVNERADGAGARNTYFYGLTDTSSHGRVMARVAIEMQAARYVRFALEGAVGGSTSYLLTFADACNPNVDVGDDDPRRGDCRTGIINPHHRPVIDMPGRRFRMQGELTLDFAATAIAQF